jgi:hypothetical protein
MVGRDSTTHGVCAYLDAYYGYPDDQHLNGAEPEALPHRIDFV